MRLIVSLLLIGALNLYAQDDKQLGRIDTDTGCIWSMVAPVGTCAACGRSMYPSYCNTNFYVEVWRSNRLAWVGCLDCLIATIHSAKLLKLQDAAPITT